MREVTRSEKPPRALDQHPGQEASATSPHALAADLIPRKGLKSVQSARLRELTRSALRIKGSG